MKRLILLLALFVLFANTIQAQIRIEKRHYNKGWYISLNDKHKKETTIVNSGTKNREQKNDSVLEENKTIEVRTQERISFIKDTTAFISQPKSTSSIANSVMHDLKKKISTSAKKEHACITKNFAKAKGYGYVNDPGDSFWAYLFDGFAGPLTVIFYILAGLAILGLIVKLISLVILAIGMGWEYVVLLIVGLGIWVLWSVYCN
jgi:hypothetical protein